MVEYADYQLFITVIFIVLFLCFNRPAVRPRCPSPGDSGAEPPQHRLKNEPKVHDRALASRLPADDVVVPTAVWHSRGAITHGNCECSENTPTRQNQTHDSPAASGPAAEEPGGRTLPPSHRLVFLQRASREQPPFPEQREHRALRGQGS
ncbi:hypothetical protein EYF80_065413 [Liparis tanakae]|uniref:Uncharacterized protein n=1 Tax=Liparis tanakae TaxID=230148 RepID=A0A4Z2E6S7_9TELE|nr:hypothetical protein EYF80_065413 [Liparis tanakae]